MSLTSEKLWIDPKDYKVNKAKQTENEWKQKRMHGQYVREKGGIVFGIELGGGSQKEI